MYQIEYFSLHDQVVKRVHDLFKRGGPVPPMNIQDVDIRCAQFLQGCLDRNAETLCVISGVVDLVCDIVLTSLGVTCILAMTSVHLLAFYRRVSATCLGCDHELVSDATFLDPLANELFRCLILARVVCELMAAQQDINVQGVLITGRINEISLLRCGLLEVRTRYTRLTYTEIEIGVKEFEGTLLIHGAHAKVTPFISNAHRT